MLPKEAGPRELAALFARDAATFENHLPRRLDGGPNGAPSGQRRLCRRGTFNRLSYGKRRFRRGKANYFPTLIIFRPKRPAKN